MKEMKYLVYHKIERRIYAIASIDFDQKMVNIGARSYPFDDVIFMPWTGLKDKQRNRYIRRSNIKNRSRHRGSSCLGSLFRKVCSVYYKE